jgi:transposase
MVRHRGFACAVGAVVHVVDPKQAARFGESFVSSGAKDDARDARVLVELGRSPVHVPAAWTPPSEARERLNGVLAEHESLVEKRVIETQQLRAKLAQTMPLVEDAIDEMDAKWARALLRAMPTSRDAKRISKAELATLMKGARKATIERMWTAIEDTHPLGMSTNEADFVRRFVARTLDRLAQLDEQIVAVMAEIETALDAFAEADAILDIPGFGVKLTACVLLFGDFEGDRDLTALRMGVSPVFVGSGRRADGTPKGVVQMRKTASPTARRAAYLLGRTAVMSLPWAKAQFAASRARGKNAATAYRHVVRSLLRVVGAVVRTGQPYDDQRYVATLKARGVPWAQAMPS